MPPACARNEENDITGVAAQAGSGAKCRGHVEATKRALISIEPRVVVTVSYVRARDAAPVRQAESCCCCCRSRGRVRGHGHDYLHSTGCQFEAHPQAIGTGALTHIEYARVIFIEISAICADFYMGMH